MGPQSVAACMHGLANVPRLQVCMLLSELETMGVVSDLALWRGATEPHRPTTGKVCVRRLLTRQVGQGGNREWSGTGRLPGRARGTQKGGEFPFTISFKSSALKSHAGVEVSKFPANLGCHPPCSSAHASLVPLLLRPRSGSS